MHNNKTITATWFEVAIKVERAQDDGSAKFVKETYCLDAMSFTEAETRIYKEFPSLESSSILTIKRAQYSEFISAQDSTAEKYWRVKSKLIELNEKTSKPKKTPLQVLVCADTNSDAYRIVSEVFSEGMYDFEISDINESPVIDVLRYDHEA